MGLCCCLYCCFLVMVSACAWAFGLVLGGSWLRCALLGVWLAVCLFCCGSGG